MDIFEFAKILGEFLSKWNISVKVEFIHLDEMMPMYQIEFYDHGLVCVLSPQQANGHIGPFLTDLDYFKNKGVPVEVTLTESAVILQVASKSYTVVASTLSSKTIAWTLYIKEDSHSNVMK